MCLKGHFMKPKPEYIEQADWDAVDSPPLSERYYGKPGWEGNPYGHVSRYIEGRGNEEAMRGGTQDD